MFTSYNLSEKLLRVAEMLPQVIFNALETIHSLVKCELPLQMMVAF